ncbi:MAG: nodulation protein NfeD [Tannerella sp.]|jgi:membrane-bound serine protease (ClpP class)|nr:nodulation protein NfeD [Tannerella sp.]
MKVKIQGLFFCISFLLSVFSAYGHSEAKPLVYRIDIREEIDHKSQLQLSRGLEEARQLGAKAVLLCLNTYGGQVDMADSMRTAILYSPIPVYVFVDNNAASAGALISIAAKKIYMREGATIGAATVVNQTGAAMPDKYQSYMRAMMRATAEAQGKDTLVEGGDTLLRWVRDPHLAEAMVDQRIVIPHLVDSTKVLTLTAKEAVKWGYCDGIAESPEEVITRFLGFHDYQEAVFTPSWIDNVKGFLMSPFLQSLFILVIIGGLYFELQSPGIGFPLIAAVLAAVLYFAPLYIDGLAQNWEILMFVGGLVLLALELFVIPGFGITGICGILLIVAGLFFSLLNNLDFGLEGVSRAAIGQASLTVLFGLLLGFGLTLWLSNRIGRKGFFRRIALETDLEDSVSAPLHEELAGSYGVAATVLRPSGKVRVGDEVYDAVSESGFIEKGRKVKILRTENAQIYVVDETAYE